MKGGPELEFQTENSGYYRNFTPAKKLLRVILLNSDGIALKRVLFSEKDTLKDLVLRVSHFLAIDDNELHFWRPDFGYHSEKKILDYL